MNDWAASMGPQVHHFVTPQVHLHRFTKQLVPVEDNPAEYIEVHLCSCGELGHEITEEKEQRLRERQEAARKSRKVVSIEPERRASWCPACLERLMPWKQATIPGRGGRLYHRRCWDEAQTSVVLAPPAPSFADVLKDTLEDELRVLWAAERGMRAIWGTNPSVLAAGHLERYRDTYRLLNGIRQRAKAAMREGT